MKLTSLVVLLASTTATGVLGVKHEDFKLCSQTSFCRRLRSIATREPSTSPYSLEGAGVPLSASSDPSAPSWTFPVRSSLYPDITFELQLDVLEDDVARIRMDEVGSSTPWKRYNETAKWALVGEPNLGKAKISTDKGVSTITYGGKGELVVEIQHEPLRITQKRDGVPLVVVNERNLLHMEHFRVKQEVKQEVTEGEQVAEGGEQAVFAAPSAIDRTWFEDIDGEMFEERWKTWTDTKPKGPEGLSVDITFPGVEHIFGLPEHASPLSLPSTIGPDAYYSDPYRLYNVDIFEYLADSEMALYGAIPLVHAHSASTSVGVFNLVASETWVDVAHTPPSNRNSHKGSVHTHWMSESGILDILILPGPRPDDLFKQYAKLTGPTPLPPQWSTAFHQCRWNYLDEADVLSVDENFDAADIPLDVTWLDIEYAEEHRYFDWDPKYFPDPVRMLDAVASKGRKMVAIVDPHIKKTDSFRIYTDARDLDILVKKADGNNFEGWCWTGSSVWVDFFNPNAWTWWTRMFSFDVWQQSTKALFIWNDMNEPSVFDGPEITMTKDSIHADGWEHRDVHNLNGMMFHNQTSKALIAREQPAKRPFVLSRSFFAGSQKYGAIWTGDNIGDWEHLAGETAMLLSNNIAGMSFCGADVGGFFGNPSTELLVRWHQAGAFMPFFRAHAHIDTKRREPYLYEEPTRSLLRDAIRLRYILLPVWYNAFHDASIDGSPIMRPQYAVFPNDPEGFAIDDQYYVGDSGLLFKPVVQEGATAVEVYISDDQPYYDYFTHLIHPAQSKPRRVSLPVSLETVPLLIQGGSIVPTRERVRRASSLMWQDPFTLTVALDKDGGASGQLYLDDGDGYTYTSGEFVWKRFTFTPRAGKAGRGGSLVATAAGEKNAFAESIKHVEVEKIIVLGLASAPTKVSVAGEEVEFEYHPGAEAVSGGKKEKQASRLVVKRPGVTVVGAWEVSIE